MTRLRAAVASLSVVLAVSALAGCGAADPSPPVADPSASPSDPGTGAATAHVVPSPGPLTGALHSADLLVYSQVPLDPGMVATIRATPGVTAVEQFSMAQVSIEDKLMTVAAVDPATYRTYAPYASANLQEAWDRVAAGELAIAPADKGELRPNAAGDLKLGSAQDAPAVHVGAYADQVLTIDAVVNLAWGAALGMPADNALIVSTSITSPDRVYSPIVQLVGSGTSVQRLDVAARTGIDTQAVQTAYVVGSATDADAVGHYSYSVLGGGRIAPDPAWVSAHIVTRSVPILGPVTCNTMLFPQLTAALQEVVDEGLSSQIHAGEYGGCYNPRFIAGTHTLSNHAFGLAIDLNVPGNQRGTPGQMSRQVVAIFERWGFTWGGTWAYTDPMHFELNRLMTVGQQ